MGHHIDSKGRFQSDKYPQTPPDKVVLSLTDPKVQPLLLLVATAYETHDAEFAEDLRKRVLELMEKPGPA